MFGSFFTPTLGTQSLILGMGLACGIAGLWPANAHSAEPGRTAVAARALNAEERLDAIRRGLVQAALEGATRVESVAWLDGEGRLHESSSFRSGMQVRGVQVLAYLRDRDGQPQAKLSLPPAGSEAATGKDARRDLVKSAAIARTEGRCEARPDRLRHLIGLELAVGGRWTAQDAPLAQGLAELAGAAWLQAAGPVPADALAAETLHWRMLPAGDGLMKTEQDSPRTPYEQAMLGTTATPMPWTARLQVMPVPLSAVTQGSQGSQGSNPFLKVFQGAPPAPVTMARISLSLQAGAQAAQGQSAQGGLPRSALTLIADVPLQRQPSQWGAPQLTPAARAQVLALMARWSQTLNSHLACETVRPEVVTSANGTLRMNVGALAGVQPGEEWLLADPQAFPERLLAPGVAQQLVLAKVLKVHERHAELQLLAGPARPVQSGWRAWRAESPLQDLQD